MVVCKWKITVVVERGHEHNSTITVVVCKDSHVVSCIHCNQKKKRVVVACLLDLAYLLMWDVDEK